MKRCGPVADALLNEPGADFTIACPAFPENGRTIYLGHLFVFVFTQLWVWSMMRAATFHRAEARTRQTPGFLRWVPLNSTGDTWR